MIESNAEAIRKIGAKVILASLAIVLLLFYMKFNRGYAVDDSYITFRYAQNALLGHGFVFNVGQHYYGSTATGYAMLLALLVKMLSTVGVLVDIHQVSTLLSALSIAIVAWVCARLIAGDHGSRVRLLPAAAVLMLIFVLPLSSAVAAHETYFYVGLLALASHLAIFARRMYLATVVLVAANLIRPDSALFAVILFSALGVTALSSSRSMRVPFGTLCKSAALFAALLFAWLLSMKLYYGTFFPGTMDAKRAQVALGYWPLFNLDNVSTTMNQLFGGGYWKLLLPASIAALVLTVRLSRTSIRFVDVSVSPAGLYCGVWTLFAVGLVLAYCTFHVTLWTWYVVPIGLALIIACCAAVSAVLDNLSPGTQELRGWYAGGASVFLVMIAFSATPSPKAMGTQFFKSQNVNGHLTSYDRVVGYLRAVEPEGTGVAIAEPGTFGYKLGPNYTVYDVLGLASPGVAKALLKGDQDYVVRTWHPKYVVWSWTGTFNPSERPGFSDEYELLGEFLDPYWTNSLKRGAYLYRRRADAGTHSVAAPSPQESGPTN